MAKRTNIIDLPVANIIAGIKNADRVMLGRAITLVESRHPAHQAKGAEVLTELLRQRHDTMRVAISGSPGVGKSTFIESLGIQLVEKGHKVAVLSIDPSSDINKGSILGDKTRMERLSIHDQAFIRPSPAGDFLGGIAWRTREAITICEAAGFDVILVETVGVGQSEFKVKEMVDCFFLLLAPGGGDELQGIKKGIVEIADIISINKCDGALETTAKQTRKAYSQALHLFPTKVNGWNPKVINSSGETGLGLEKAWALITEYHHHIKNTGYIHELRQHQDVTWFEERMAMAIHQYIRAQASADYLQKVRLQVYDGSMNPINAADQIVKSILK